MFVLPDWTTACLDWEDRILNRRSLLVSPPLFPGVADEADRIFGALTMVDVAGEPTMAEAMQPWAKDVVRAIFGAYDPESGRRHINEALLCLAKKNGKSSLAAGIMLTALVMNWRKSGEYIILAPTKEIADNAFRPIRDMIRADDELGDLLHVQEHMRMVTHRATAATLKVVAADSDTVSGKKAIGVFVDELHEFGSRPRAENMLLEATGGLASRPEGFVIYATTQSAEQPAGVFKQKLDYARGVRDGRIVDKSFLPVIYEYPKWMLDKGLHRDLANAYVPNPNWGVSVDEARIEKLHKQAQEQGEESFRLFMAKHLNVEVGLNLRADRWTGAEFWEKAARKRTLDELIDLSDVLTLGIDGGGLDDLLGAAVIGRHGETGEWMHWGKAWAHPIVLERRKSEASKLNDMAAAGDLTIIQTIGDDMDELEVIGKRLEDTGKLLGVGVDPAGIAQIEKMLREECGIDLGDDGGDRIYGVSQGWKLTAIIKTVERMLAQGTFTHCGQALMAWAVGNAMVEPRGNAVLITKAASGTGKIDPLIALFCAAEVMAKAPELNICSDPEVVFA